SKPTLSVGGLRAHARDDGDFHQPPKPAGSGPLAIFPGSERLPRQVPTTRLLGAAPEGPAESRNSAQTGCLRERDAYRLPFHRAKPQEPKYPCGHPQVPRATVPARGRAECPRPFSIG